MTVAVFAMGMMFESSFKLRDSNYQRNANEGGFKGSENDTRDKITDWLLVACNIFLVGFVFVQIRDSRKSSERQLRAYVYIEKTRIEKGPKEWKVKFTIKNFGQTPAHRVRIKYDILTVDWNEAGTAVPVPSEPSLALGSMGPVTDFYDLYGSAENATLDEVTDGTKAIYLNGVITYDSVFELGLQSPFRYYVGGDMGWDGPGEMCADEEGNDAT